MKATLLAVLIAILMYLAALPGAKDAKTAPDQMRADLRPPPASIKPQPGPPRHHHHSGKAAADQARGG
jgi:hypothetical protein